MRTLPEIIGISIIGIVVGIIMIFVLRGISNVTQWHIIKIDRNQYDIVDYTKDSTGLVLTITLKHHEDITK